MKGRSKELAWAVLAWIIISPLFIARGAVQISRFVGELSTDNFPNGLAHTGLVYYDVLALVPPLMAVGFYLALTAFLIIWLVLLTLTDDKEKDQTVSTRD